MNEFDYRGWITPPSFMKGEGDYSAILNDSDGYDRNIAPGDYALAEGHSNKAIGNFSHAEGKTTVAKGHYSHTEGVSTIVLGEDDSIHTEWDDGYAAHAEGQLTTAGGRCSHAEGDNTVANNPGEHAEGRYNISNYVDGSTYGNPGNTQHSVGIGNPDTPKNAFEIMQNGDIYMIGVGGYDGTNPDTAQTVQEVISGS